MNADSVRRMTGAKSLMLLGAIAVLAAFMLSIKEVHRFLNTGAVIPLLLTAVIAEQVNRRNPSRAQVRGLLSGIQIVGFVLSASIMVAAGVLRQ